ncbi:isopenicillin-N N-acyltransferase-like protein [Murinocardiopsis flavida]|uniref:Isopenicillin-N N-acyltransferase-like protein n=1 Tax=Murinocardiopsis flavida TaxID=645275 RepID=A0A2P8DSW4_9ACTN|nr:C45 family peptidase [Murinocardiopsis flavida]PSL00301.1 isopenicillin-N N-acyltransferase-like protein [Murinocardiopsis flavida]
MSVPTFTSSRADGPGRAREFGRAWSAEIRAGFDRYLGLFAAYGAEPAQVRSWSEQALERTAEWAPGLAAEIEGMAAGSGLAVWQAGALNARTEVLAAARYTGDGECSTAVVLPGGGAPPRTMQTWDWHAALGGGVVVWAFEPSEGRTVRCFTELGVLGKVGVNSAGLGVHFNILRHASDHDRIGVPVHVVARRILDEADTVGAAAEIARSARVSASTVVTAVAFDGAQGDAAALELCPDGVAEVRAGDDGVLLHTNHFVDPALAKGETVTPAESTTFGRLAMLGERTAGLSSPEPIDRARAMRGTGADGVSLCRHTVPGRPVDQDSETLLTIGLDVAAGRLEFHRGGPCGVDEATWQTF